MKVQYSWKDDLCEASLSDEPDWMMFNGVADAILRKFKGRLVERLDGLDERYWDIQIGERIVTLHLQHYLGIMLFPEDQRGNELIQEVGRYLERVEPKRLFKEWFYVKNAFRIRGRRRTSASSGTRR